MVYIATMVIFIVTNFNGKGLERDAEILREILLRDGHKVRCIGFHGPVPTEPVDLMIHLEVINPCLFSFAEKHWLMPNPEWFAPEWRLMLRKFDRVLCKTRQAMALFESLGAQCVFTGFCSRDLRDRCIPRERRFLHLAGKSRAKNTAAILDAWRSGSVGDADNRPELTLVSEHFLETARGIPGVTALRRVGGTELRELMNTHRFHLCPSAAEGWGHYIHEALGCGVVVVTTDAPPMNELPERVSLRVPCEEGSLMSLVPAWRVSRRSISDAVNRCLSLSDSDCNGIGEEARAEFESERVKFEQRLLELVADAEEREESSLPHRLCAL